MLATLTVFLSVLFLSQAGRSDRPNIIFILADDLGWNDLSLHGSPQIPTPNIDALASSSLILHNYYVQPICTPSRAALMTGLYPIRLGLQNHVLFAGEQSGLPIDIITMPQHLKKLGFATHMVGKWHLGYHKKEFTPTFRGFDTFFGFYNGYLDYYDYSHFWKPSETWGVDLHDGSEIVTDFRGQYATDVFTSKGVDIINRHNASQPLFLYMAYSAPHTGNFNIEPLQAPVHLIARHRHIKDKKRRTYAAMVSSLDDGVGKIFEALHRKSLLDNTILVFSSDNGAESGSYMGGVGSSWPLRGVKRNLWEGGVRVPAFVWSPLLGLQEPRTSTQLMHITDWLPTFYTAAGGKVQDLGTTDGYNLWDTWLHNLPSPRSVILHNIDPIIGMSALRWGDYKLINGTFPNNLDGWDNSTKGFEDGVPISMDEYVFNFSKDSVVKDILQASGRWLPTVPDVWRAGLSLQCKQPPPNDDGGCDPTIQPCLFNVAADPCEYNNLALRYPRVVKSMMKTIQMYAQEAVEPQIIQFDPRSDPKCHGFAHVSWMDEEYINNCPCSSYPEPL